MISDLAKKLLFLSLTAVLGFVLLVILPGGYGPLIGLPLIIISMVAAPVLLKQI